MQKLNQIIAVEKGIKERANREITDNYHVGQKGEPFSGMTRTYTPKDDKGEGQPSQQKLVQMRVRDVLSEVRKSMGELFDITATKDYANCNAKADVVVDGVVLLEKVPATFLLFLEKNLVHLHTIVQKLPTLSADHHWTLDEATSLFKSQPVETTSTSKEQVPIVLYAATEKHPAQTQLITKDMAVGTWTTTQLSGAMPVQERERLLDRIERLQRAVKFARESANGIDAPPIEAGVKVLGWILEGKGAAT